MEGHAKKCVERYCELANKTTQQPYKVSTPCIHDRHFKEKVMKSVGELSKVCSQIVLKCLYLARIGRCKENTSRYSNSRTNGYVKVCITTSTPSTPLRPLWTITRVTRRTLTCATCRIEHTCTLSLVALSDHLSHSTWLKPVRTFHSISMPSMMCGCL